MASTRGSVSSLAGIRLALKTKRSIRFVYDLRIPSELQEQLRPKPFDGEVESFKVRNRAQFLRNHDLTYDSFAPSTNVFPLSGIKSGSPTVLWVSSSQANDISLMVDSELFSAYRLPHSTRLSRGRSECSGYTHSHTWSFWI